MNKTNQIIRAYTAGDITLEQANAQLKAAGTNLVLNPYKNAFTPEQIAATHVGNTPREATGWGLLDTGTGTFEKVQVRNGKTVDYDNGANTNYALVLIGGKMYKIVNHNELVDIEG